MIGLLDKYLNNEKIDDYIDHMKYKPIVDNYKKIKQYSLEEALNIIKDKIPNMIKEMKDINIDIIYNSEIHGVKHNRRVIFYAYIISYVEKLNDKDLRVLLDGCKYHDIGRTNDNKDDSHGMRSAKMIKPFIKYSDINYLQAIIEIHSLDESNEEKIINKYKVEKKRFEKLYKILKDADNLDRVRLDKTLNYSWLDPNYLRTKTSKKLVKIARQLNGGDYD